jgi:hypothetical protein
MQIITKFDPSAEASGNFALSELSNGIGTFILWNESNWTLDITMPNGDTDIAPAWTASIFAPTGPQGQVTWTQDAQLDQVMPPQSKVWVIAYQTSENIAGTFPLALVRQTSVGNVVTTSGGNVTNLINDGNISNTQIIESTVVSDTGSAVSVTNNGIVAIGTTANPGSITLKGPISTDNGTLVSNGSGTLTAVAVKTNTAKASDGSSWASVTAGSATRIQNASQVVLQVPGGTTVLATNSTGVNVTGTLGATGDITSGGTLHTTGTITDSADNSWASVTAGSVTRIQNATQVVLQVPGGTTVLSATSTGVNVTGTHASSGTNTASAYLLAAGSGNYGLYTNSLSRWSDFSGTGSVTVNHNLGATPSFAWCWCNASASSQTMGNTQTSTQVTVTAGAGLAWHGCAVRY